MYVALSESGTLDRAGVPDSVLLIQVGKSGPEERGGLVTQILRFWYMVGI